MHTLDHAPIMGRPDVSDSQHPGNNLVTDAAYGSFDDTANTDFTRGETLITSVYESLRAPGPVRPDAAGDYVRRARRALRPCRAAAGRARAEKGARGAALAHLLLEKASAAFDLSMLGPSVPAVIVSPLIPAGKVDTTVRDHAAIPATLRALFAPRADPLTPRDAWAPPLHGLMTLDEPRAADLPDLSAYAARATAEAAAVYSVAGGEGLVADVAADVAALPSKVPEYHRGFLHQAELVWDRLARLEAPEAAGPLDASEPRRAVQISSAFTAAAERHRSLDMPPMPARTLESR
jgi:phospholipase C